MRTSVRFGTGSIFVMLARHSVTDDTRTSELLLSLVTATVFEFEIDPVGF